MRQDNFPYPLPESALAEFAHPAEWHLFRQPMRYVGEILAGNGYVALRAHRGGWLDHEFPAATADFLSRFGKLPWARWESLHASDWRTMDEEQRRIRSRGSIGLWLNGKLAPSPVWRVNEVIPVRLSLLQLIARLPRAEVWCGPQDKSEPLFFRFSGGRGIIAADSRLDVTRTSGKAFAARQSETGERLGKRPVFQGLNPSGSAKQWPPADHSEI